MVGKLGADATFEKGRNARELVELQMAALQR